MPTVLFFFALILGSCLGSFTMTMAYRIIHEDSLWPSSHCEFCRQKIGIVGLIPIVGYLFLKGQCRKCHSKIPPYYPLYELLSGCFVVAILWKTGWTLDFFYTTFFFQILLLLALIDFVTYMIIPYPILLGIIAQTFWLFFVEPTRFQECLTGLFIGAGVFHFISWLYQVIRKRVGLGEGDATLLGLIGYWVGWKAILPIIFMSSFIGVVGGMLILTFQKKKYSQPIAFAPWLVMGGILYWFFPQIEEWFYPVP